MRVLAPAFLCCCVVTALADNLIRLSEKENAKLPTWATVVLSGDPQVDLLPSHFFCEPINAKIRIVNDSDSEVSIDDIDSSCGCTTAAPIVKSIAARSESALLLRYTPKRPGTQHIAMSFAVGGKRFEIKGNVTASPRIVARQTDLLFDDYKASLELDVKDDTIDLKKITLAVMPATFKLGNPKIERRSLLVPVSFDRNLAHAPGGLTVVAEGLHPLHLKSRYKGVVAISPKTLFVSRKQEQVRLFLIGDVQLPESPFLISLRIGKEEVETAASCVVADGVATVVIDNPAAELSPGKHNVDVPSWGVRFQLMVR